MTNHSGAKEQEAGDPGRIGDDRLTMAEAARLKGVSYHTVSRAVRKGRLPVVRLGRMALISAHDLQEWHPMRERAPRKFRRPTTLEDAPGSIVSLLSADHIDLATRLAGWYELIHSASEMNLDALAQIATERVAEAFQLTRMTLWRIGDASNQANRLARVGSPLSDLPDTLSLDRSPFFLRLINVPHARIVSDVRAETGEDVANLSGAPGGPLLVVPLIRKEHVVGVMFGDRDGADIDFTNEQLALADGISRQMAMAIDNAMLRDTERLRRVQLEAILGALTGAVSAFDECGNLTLSNLAEQEMFDLTETEARLGQPMQAYLRSKRFVSLDDTPVPTEEYPVARALRGERVQNQVHALLRKDGERRTVSTNARPMVVDGRITGAVAVSRDITAEYAADRLEAMRLKQLERAAQRAQAVADLVIEINAGQDAQSVSEAALHRIAAEIGADAGVMLLRDEQGLFHVVTVYGEPRHRLPERGLDLRDAPQAARAFTQYRPIIVPADTLEAPESMLGQVAGSGQVMIIPLQIRGQRIGVAYLSVQDRASLDESDLTFGAVWGRQCAQAIDKVMLVDQLEFAHGRLMAIIDQLVQAVMIVDAPGGEVVISNRAAETLWGRHLDEDHIRADMLPVIDEEGYPVDEADHPLTRPLRTQEQIVGEPLTVVRPDGSRVDVLASHSPLFDARGAIIGSVSVLQDRADFKPLDRSKDEFISVVAHELRNPLTSLRGNLQLLQRRFRKRGDESVEQDVERIDSIITQVDRIADLVSRMLDVSRVDLGSLDISVAEADAGLLVRSVLMEAQGLKPDRPIEFHGPETLPVIWDAARVQQVLGNLMQNAARYAPEGPVEVKMSRWGDDRVRITVRDHGPGVPARIRKRLFKQYHRFDDGQESRSLTANGDHGLGIGLYISARLARAHGGSLTVDNAQNGGAIFTLELPIDARPSESTT